MTDQTHNPPAELVEHWCSQLFGCDDKPELAAYELARLAAVDINYLVCRDSIAAALLEAINQCQDGNGLISAPELHRIAEHMRDQTDD